MISVFTSTSLHRWLRISGMLLMAVALFSSVGCKSKKKQAEEQAQAEDEARAAQVERLKSELQAMMDDSVVDFNDLQQRENRLTQIKAMNVDDPGVRTLIRKVEYFLQQERERLERERAEAEREKAEAEAKDQEAELRSSLNRMFSNIAQAGSVDRANREIDRTMGMFASGEVPVFIVIGVFDGQKDYDEPTTIQRYLNYLKDQQKNPNRISEIKTDSRGRIVELELTKTGN